MTVLLKTGRWSGRIRPLLRPLLAREGNQNALVNDLLAKHYKVPKNAPKSVKAKGKK